MLLWGWFQPHQELQGSHFSVQIRPMVLNLTFSFTKRSLVCVCVCVAFTDPNNLTHRHYPPWLLQCPWNQILSTKYSGVFHKWEHKAGSEEVWLTPLFYLTPAFLKNVCSFQIIPSGISGLWRQGPFFLWHHCCLPEPSIHICGRGTINTCWMNLNEWMNAWMNEMMMKK